MKNIIILALILLLIPLVAFSQDAADGRVGFSLSETSVEKPGLTMFTGSDFIIKNTVSGGSAALSDFSFWIGARVALSYSFDKYTIAPYLMTQLFTLMTPKIEIEDGIYYSKTSTLLNRARLQFGVENRFALHDWANLNINLQGKFQVDFDSLNPNNVKYIPEIQFNPTVSLSGRGNNFSYFVSANVSPNFYVGSPEYTRFKDSMGFGVGTSLEYDILKLWVEDPQYQLNLFTELSLNTSFTKDDSKRSEAAKLSNALGYSGYEAEYFLGARGKIDRIIPTVGVWMSARDSMRINDEIYNNIFLGAKVGLGFQGEAWTFLAEYKGGPQINEGTYMVFVPQKNWSKFTISASIRL